jgi:hypothetical protein
MFGVDYYFTKLVSLGIDLDAEVLFMQRPVTAVTLPSDYGALTPQQQQQVQQALQLYQQSGSSIGLSASVAPHFGIHF